jgi:peptidoglycan/LPS O-acetylase OafA/YrhL
VTDVGVGGPAPVVHLHALDLLRGVAAVVVLVFHAHAVFGRQWAPGGYLAVDVFFVMSGCVLAHAYESRLRAGWGLRAFLWRRVLRFWPLHALGLVVGLGAEVVARMVKGVPLAPGELVGWVALGSVFLPVVGTAFMFPLNSPGWSLLHEFVVNGVYARVAPWLRTRVLVGVCALSGVALGLTVVAHGKADVGVSLIEFGPACADVAGSARVRRRQRGAGNHRALRRARRGRSTARSNHAQASTSSPSPIHTPGRGSMPMRRATPFHSQSSGQCRA